MERLARWGWRRFGDVSLVLGTRDPVLLTEASRCLLDASVEVEARGEVALKGKADLVPVYAPLAVDAARAVGR
jgi:hypothetical protein